jgi:CheY-like chemotaxis protein
MVTFSGALVQTALSAREAAPLVSVVDVVVIDLSMPGGDGRWLLAQVQSHPRPVPVILLIGYGDHYDLTGLPFARVLRKPIDPRHLVAQIRVVLEGA